jgi:hypothetical protein
MVQTKFSQSLHVCVVPDDPGIKSVPSQHTDPGLVVVESCPIRVHQRLAKTLRRVLRDFIASRANCFARVPTLFDVNVSQFAWPRDRKPNIEAAGLESIALAKGCPAQALIEK